MYSCVVYVTNRTKSPTCRKTVHRKTHGAVEQDIHWFGFRTNTSQKILVQLQSLALEIPTVEFLANELKRLACEQALHSGGGVGKGRRACNYISGIWIPPPILLWLPVDWPDMTREAETIANVNKHWKTCAKGNDVITNVIFANQHFALTFLM